ncbi:hypothetical protein GGF46_004602 [Coemansia sp. RSA 552]|nr:hypothetical protein GGF46_004602 [Coemansia sp. RSA 552]
MISIIISKLMNQPNFTAFLPATSKEDERIQEHVCSYIEVIKTAFPKTHIILVEDSAMHESLNSGTFCIVNYSAVWYGTAKHIAEPSAFIVPCPRNPIFDAKRRLNLSTMMLYAHFKHIMELGQRDGLNFKYGGFLPVGVMHRAGVFYPTVQLNTSTEHKVKFELLSLI